MNVFEAPTWREASPGIAFALRYGSPTDVEEATKALMQMARLADAMAIVITHERSGVIPLYPEES